MLHLEKLTLFLRLSQRTSFIDGAHLENSLRQLSNLHTFRFDFVTEHVNINGQIKPSFDDIRRTFTQRGSNVDGYIDCNNYLDTMWGRCHIYSLPSDMEYLQQISHDFHGGIFMNVGVLCIRDTYHSFEHSFFVRISHPFPSLRRLSIQNKIEQKEKSHELSSISEFSHLVELDCIGAHINYVEQFLCDLNTCLPSLNKFCVQYEHLITITENFTRNATRINCAKLNSIKFDDKITIVYSREFYLYFPLL